MATPSFTLDEAMSIASQAFLPYRCVTLPHAEDASFAMRIHDDADREILSVPHVARSQYSDPVRLAGMLEQARLDLSKDGYSLLPWSMPFQPDLIFVNH